MNLHFTQLVQPFHAQRLGGGALTLWCCLRWAQLEVQLCLNWLLVAGWLLMPGFQQHLRRSKETDSLVNTAGLPLVEMED